MLIFIAHASRWLLMGEAADAKADSRISHASRLQTFQRGDVFDRHVAECDFRIDSQVWLKMFWLELGARDFVQAGAERIDFCRVDGDAGGHGVAAVADEQVAAFPQAGGEIETFNAAAGAAELSGVAAEDECWTVESLHDA